MHVDRLDAGLSAGLGPAAAAALREWAAQNDLALRLGYWLTGVDSVAKVGLVREHGDDGTRNIIVKLDAVRGLWSRETGGAGLGEFARQRRAIHDRPRFAARHLVKPAHPPLHVGDGTWLMFHEVAGGSMRDFATLGNVLDGFLHPQPPPATRMESAETPGTIETPGTPGTPGTPESPGAGCDAEGFARACGGLVRSILVDWAQRPRVVTATVPEFLDWHRRLAGAAGTAGAAPRPPAHVDRDAQMPDVAALLADPARTAGVVVPALVGMAHGDLRLDNVLVPVRPKVGLAGYRLVDMSAYADDAPLTRDVVNLMLDAAARTLPDLSPSQRDALIDLLADQAQVGPLIPGWLHMVVRRVETTAEEWARRFSLVDEWREQIPLAVLACALNHAAGSHCPDEDRTWFRQLAARAGAAFMARRGLTGLGLGRGAQSSRASASSPPFGSGQRARAPAPARVTLSALERDALVRALARAFPTDAVAHHILHILGFPAERRRSTTESTPLAMWSATLLEFDNGAVADPYPRLLRAALAEFPHNQAFRDLGDRLGVRTDPPGE